MRRFTSREMMKYSKTMSVSKNDCVGIFEEHTHDFVELVYILSGKAEHVVDGKRYLLNRGDILFMNCGCIHSFSSESEHTYVNILFSPEFIGEDIVTPENAFSLFSLTAFNQMRSDAEFGKISFFDEERSEVEGIINSMLREFDSRNTYWESAVRNYLNNLIIKMLRKSEEGFKPAEINGTWQELSAYIDENLGSRLSLSELAEKFFYNPSYFSRVFKEKFGLSLIEYKTKKRVESAAELLEKTELTIDEICDNLGFSERSSFYNAFKKRFGTSPASYRIERKK